MRSREEVIKRRDQYLQAAEEAKLNANVPVYSLCTRIAQELDWAAGNATVTINPQKVNLKTK